ncbi:hypothetical protein BJY04DRAFT_217488 [Aspergillus karnatakaensis]|uniref:uncharacterized protein n=1 Tax=Aspergillus karnatakaensis TaxID=1810916 RepID=UPI003CCD925E
MARTVQCVILRPEPNSHPPTLFDKINQYRESIPYEQRQEFLFELRSSDITIEHVDSNSVVLMTKEFSHAFDEYSDPPLSRYTNEDHVANRGDTSADEHRAWKTSRVYEVIGGSHPRLVRFIQRDPWTALPIVERPSGGTLSGFCRGISLAFFQWALQLLSGLAFIHSKNVVLGDLHKQVCWLQSPSPATLDISILGFLDAVYTDPRNYIRYMNDNWGYEHDFHPKLIPGRGVGPGGRWDRDMATVQTDLFLWACLVFELLTGDWPGEDRERDLGEIQAIIDRRLWPRLEGEGKEAEGLNGFLRKCWEFAYFDAGEVKRDLGRALKEAGWVLEGIEVDGIQGIDVTKIVGAGE